MPYAYLLTAIKSPVYKVGTIDDEGILATAQSKRSAPPRQWLKSGKIMRPSHRRSRFSSNFELFALVPIYPVAK